MKSVEIPDHYKIAEMRIIAAYINSKSICNIDLTNFENGGKCIRVSKLNGEIGIHFYNFTSKEKIEAQTEIVLRYLGGEDVDFKKIIK
jgi:hypothetical protein